MEYEMLMHRIHPSYDRFDLSNFHMFLERTFYIVHLNIDHLLVHKYAHLGAKIIDIL